MKPVQLAPLFVTALLAGWFAPSLSTNAGDTNAAEEASEPTTQTSHSIMNARTDKAWLAGQTVLNREADGHFYARGHVGGYQYRFLVDTGASVVALTGQDADAMGLAWEESSLQPIGRGASGTVYGVPTVIESMEVGGYEVRDVQAAIIPEGLDISLLGQSFLSKIDNVEISGDEMRLGG